MNGIKKVFAVLLITVFAVVPLTGCKTQYEAASSFSYSADKGHSYGDGTKEYAIGDTVYMKVKFKVTSNKKKTSQVKVVLTIPKIDNVDAKYMDGQVITPNFDAVEPGEYECVIQFIPNAVGSVTMTLVYDDSIDPSYDIQSTLEFVEPQPTTGEQ